MSNAENKPLRMALVVTGEPIATVRQRRGTWATLMREAIAPGIKLEELDARTGELPSLAGYDGVVVTGSAASVTERVPWVLHTERRLVECVDQGGFVLGVCFGHQLLAQALGGEVQRNPRGREIGSVELAVLESDPLFESQRFLVNMTHVDSVVRLPPGVRVLASTERDPNAALRFGERVWGVQFHPEMDADVMRSYVDGRRELLDQEGLDGGRILSEVAETPAGRAVLGRFLARVAGAVGRS